MVSGADNGKDTLAAFGLPEQAVEKLSKAEECNVWKCNWKTVMLANAMMTQWRISMSGPVGMDYAALPVVAKILGIRLTPTRLDGVRVIEAEILKAMSERNVK